MGACYLSDDIEPKSHAAALPGSFSASFSAIGDEAYERVEYRMQLFLGDQGAFIVDGHMDFTSRSRNFYLDRFASGAMLYGIAQQIGNGLRNALLVSFSIELARRLQGDDFVGV